MFNKALPALLCLSLCGPILQADAAPRDVSHSTNAELRMEYLVKLMDSRSGKRLAEHNNGQTKAQVDDILAQARAAVAKGDNDKADALAKQALTTFMAAVRELPENPEEVSRFKNRYEDMRRGLDFLAHAQDGNAERFADDDSNKSYDKQQVKKLLAQADAEAEKGDYPQAVKTLADAQSLVTSSLHTMLNHKTLVIELDISTPEKEYYYEIRRYLGYVDLIPLAIEQKQPSEMAAETMLKMAEKADWMAEQSRDKVIAGDYPVAIRMIMDATDQLKRALRMVGIYL